MNSYILLSKVGPTFVKELEATISRIRTEWWNNIEIPAHLTIGLGKAKNEESKEDRKKRIESMKTEVQSVLDKTIDTRVYLLPSDIRITEGGHIILLFAPIPLAESNDITQLQRVHELFVTSGKKHKLYFNPKHILKNFTPHVSIGKVAPDKMQAAIEDLKLLKQKMLQELNKIRLLQLYHFDFCYGDGDPRLAKDNPNAAKNLVVASKILPPKNLDVLEAVPYQASHDADCFMLLFKTEKQAASCATYLFNFGIASHLNASNPKTVRTMTGLSGNFGLVLNRQEYLSIAGTISKCYPSVAEKKDKKENTSSVAITYQYADKKTKNESNSSSYLRSDTPSTKSNDAASTSTKRNDSTDERKTKKDKSSFSNSHFKSWFSKSNNNASKLDDLPEELQYITPYDEIADWAFKHNEEVTKKRKELGLPTY